MLPYFSIEGLPPLNYCNASRIGRLIKTPNERGITPNPETIYDPLPNDLNHPYAYRYGFDTIIWTNENLTNNYVFCLSDNIFNYIETINSLDLILLNNIWKLRGNVIYGTNIIDLFMI